MSTPHAKVYRSTGVIAAPVPRLDLVQALLLEYQRVAFQRRHDPVAGDELAAQDLLRERILDLRLDRALQGTRTVHGVESRLADPIARSIIESQLNIAFGEPLTQTAQLDVDDGADLLPAERMEHHEFIDPVDELGPKVLGDHLHHGFFHLGVIRLAGEFLNHLAAEIRGHDHHAVPKVHRPTLTVGEASVVEHLQQHVEHVRMRLLDLIEQNHAVGPAANRLGQVPALFVAHIAGRRADEACD